MADSGYTKVLDKADETAATARDLYDQAAAAVKAERAMEADLVAAEALSTAPGPTEVVPVPSGPTEAVGEAEAPELVVRKKLAGMIRNLFSELLSPNVCTIGKGILRPGIGDMKQYQESITEQGARATEDWPSGFYFGTENKETQFHLACFSGNKKVARFIIPNTYAPDDVEILVNFLHSPLAIPLDKLTRRELEMAYHLLADEISELLKKF